MSSIEQPDMEKMKKEFESKSSSEQQEILNKDQLEAISVNNMIEMKKNFEAKPESEQKEILDEDQLEAISVNNMTKMKKEFEAKPKSEQQEILKEDQLKAKSVDAQLEKDKNLPDLNSVISQLEKINFTDHYIEEKDIFSDKNIAQKTHRIEDMPYKLANSIKNFIANLEEYNFNTGINHNSYEVFCMEDLTKEDIDYIAQRFTTQFKTELINLKDGSKRIDIIPEGSRIKTQNDNITIDRLSIVCEKPRSDEDKYVILLECVRG